MSNRVNIYLLETRLTHLRNLQEQANRHGFYQYRDILQIIQSDLEHMVNVQYAFMGGPLYQRPPIEESPDLPPVIIPHMITDFVHILEVEFDLWEYPIPRRLENEFEEMPELIAMTEVAPAHPKPTTHSKVLKKADLNRLQEDVCGICLDPTRRKKAFSAAALMNSVRDVSKDGPRHAKATDKPSTALPVAKSLRN